MDCEVFELFLSTEYDDITNEHLFNCAFFSKHYHSNNIMVFTNIVQDERAQLEDNGHTNNDGRYIYDILIDVQV